MKQQFTTRSIVAGEMENKQRERRALDVVVPIHVTSTYLRGNYQEEAPFMYSRLSNPTRTAFEEKLASLESGRFGMGFASGMAATTTAVLGLLKSGQRVLAHRDLYGGTKRLFEQLLPNYGITVDYVNFFDLQAVEEAVTADTGMIWLEIISNPLLEVVEVDKIAAIANKRGVVSVVDNTLASPYFFRPLEHGASISMHSTTKYVNGHSDAIGGALILNDEELFEKLKFFSGTTGMISAPFDSYLNLRGLKTLSVRMVKHAENALAAARFLAAHPKVDRVLYPHFPAHPSYEIARRLLTGGGGCLCVYLKDADEVKGMLDRLTLFNVAESLGGVESLIGIPYYMSHGGLSDEEKKELDITPAFLRISVGIEESEDLIEDLQTALQ